ncbi:hypothetical protein MRS44_017707 [Fusarium solani]|uniref:uncharacterized protein n=1 Tax=Fusarium solani TaxID=169388 RepID=UPI0032C448E9|nr:hypothetical protein MRS44_017707 [Fusarium solani]
MAGSAPMYESLSAPFECPEAMQTQCLVSSPTAPTVCGPTPVDSSKAKDSCPGLIRSLQLTGPAGDESPGYQDERGNYGEGFVGNYGDDFVGDYGDGFVGDYGEENACQNHPELEQRMNQIIEIARVQSKQ